MQEIEIERVKARVEGLKSGLSEQKAKAGELVNISHAAHVEEVKKLKSENEAALQALRNEHAARTNDHETQMQWLKTQHEEKVKAHKEALRDLGEKHKIRLEFLTVKLGDGDSALASL